MEPGQSAQPRGERQAGIQPAAENPTLPKVDMDKPHTVDPDELPRMDPNQSEKAPGARLIDGRRTSCVINK